MLFTLIEKLPIHLVGSTVLHYLNIKDIVRLERACGSKASYKLFLDMLTHSAAIDLSPSNYNYKDMKSFDWFISRRCKIKSLTITLPGNNPVLHVKNLQVDYIILYLNSNVTIEVCNHLFESHLILCIRCITFCGDQNEEVIEKLSRLTENVETLNIYSSNNYNDWLNKDILTRWHLQELRLHVALLNLSTITLVVQICSELTSIKLDSSTVDDAVVMAIAQHCPKLEQLELPVHSEITYNSFLVLSEYKLPLKELSILFIPNIPTADIARRCSHALSCIHQLNLYNMYGKDQHASLFLPYMRGLTSVHLISPFDSYIPLPTQYCSMLTTIHIHGSYPVTDILSLCRANPLLQELFLYLWIGVSDTELIELIHACPHLYTLFLPQETDITDLGIITLSEHCPQLQILGIDKCEQITETVVLQLLQRCRKLTILSVSSSSLSEETWTQLDSNSQKRVILR